MLLRRLVLHSALSSCLGPRPSASWAAAAWFSSAWLADSVNFVPAGQKLHVASGGSATPPPPPPLEQQRDTIFALSSGAGRSAVAVVRISGPGADAALRRLMLANAALPPPRAAALTSLQAPDGTGMLDRALVLRFPGPRSFTGEDCAELHLHGSPAVVRAVLGALGMLRLRPAEPGEFSRRAFDAGKLDLTQVEGLADLLAAETESQRRQALLHSTGAVRRQHEHWRQTLLTCLARLEAVIDFGEDEEIADDVAAGVLPLVQALQQEVEGHLAAAAGGELVRSGVRVVIVGPPNAGKSSLLNLLAGHEAAIVSPFAGTTRDPVTVQLELGGVKVMLTDSAGLRRTQCPIEAEGVRRAVAAAQQAHLVLHVSDAAASSAEEAPDEGAGESMPELPLSPHAVHMRVVNKADLLGSRRTAAGPAAGAAAAAAAAAASSGGGSLVPAGVQAACVDESREGAAAGAACSTTAAAASAPPRMQQGAAPPAAPDSADRQQNFAAPAAAGMHLVSCQTGEGIEQLVAALKQQVLALVGQSGDAGFSGALVTRARHRHHLGEAVAAMRRYKAAAGEIELACEELRAAARSLGRVVGAIDVEEVLSSLFEEFCIGK
ncbi:hypothetical protein ABPG75_000087 [Micractinium tetrahymenae]